MNWIKKGLELAEKATPGPWIDSAGDVEKDEGNHRGDRALFDACNNASKDDTQFIVDARTNYPRALRLLARCRELCRLIKDSNGFGFDDVTYGDIKQLLSELEGE